MATTFRLHANELDQSFLDRIKAMFREKEISIVVYDEDETINASSPGNAPGMKMQDLRKFRGSLSNDDAESMKQAIEEECERIDPEGW